MFKILAATVPPLFIHLAGLAGTLGACARTEAKTPVSPSLTSAGASNGGMMEGDAVISELSNAWCNRSERCGLIGPGKKYIDRASCVREANQQTSSDFRAGECKSVRTPALRECVNDVEKLGCTLERDAVMMVTSCKSEELCH